MNKYDDTLAEIKTRGIGWLASAAECAAPDSDDSAGAKFLSTTRHALIEAVESGELTPGEDDDNGRVHEIADGAPSIYTHTTWLQFVDVAAYREDPSELTEDTSDMEKLAQVCLYIIAERLCHALLTELAEARAEDNDTESQDD